MKNLLQEVRHEDRDLPISVSTLGTRKGENNKHRDQLVGKKGRLMYKGVSANSL